MKDTKCEVTKGNIKCVKQLHFHLVQNMQV